MKLIFLDTETTGNDPLTDRLAQVCYRLEEEGVWKTYVGYFKPPIPITVKATSITHITNKMLADKEAFEGSQMKEDLQNLLINDGVLVAHNAKFDLAMLRAEGVEIPRFICTLRVARHLDPENKIPEYNLQYLRYYLDLEIEADAHDAEGDVLVLQGLFERLLKKMIEVEGSHEKAIETMIEVSSRPILFKYFNFGKHKGKSLDEVAETNRDYLEWMRRQKVEEGEVDEDWIYTLNHYLGR